VFLIFNLYQAFILRESLSCALRGLPALCGSGFFPLTQAKALNRKGRKENQLVLGVWSDFCGT
jgi:hypothetical protein